jgi:hypothetical protein
MDEARERGLPAAPHRQLRPFLSLQVASASRAVMPISLMVVPPD